LSFVGNGYENTMGFYTTGPDTSSDNFHEYSFQDSVRIALNAAKMHEQAIRYGQPSTNGFGEIQVGAGPSNDQDEVLATFTGAASLAAEAGNGDQWTPIQEPVDAQQSVWSLGYPAGFGQVLQSKSVQGRARSSRNIKEFSNVPWDSNVSTDVETVDTYADPTNTYTWNGEWNDYHWQNEQVAASLNDFSPQSGGEIGECHDNSMQWHQGCFDIMDYEESEAKLFNWPSHAGPGYTLKQWPVQRDKKQEITTFMLHNVPKDHTEHTLIEYLDVIGLADKYDLIYVPVDRSSHQNMGYAFINFVDAAAGKEGERILANSAIPCKRRQRCMRFKGQRCWLSPAHLQGLDQNMEHYQSTSSKPLVRLEVVWRVLPGAV
jgi:hypothetical protein